jgi:ABC-type nitrate/sulfonate/bicarbonate transport system ATPase subunit
VLDEPFSSLDILTKYSLTYEVREMIRAKRWGALVVAHDERDIVRLCDVVYILRGEVRDGQRPAATLDEPLAIRLDDWERWPCRPETVKESGPSSEEQTFFSDALNATVNALVRRLVAPRR